VGCGDGTAVEGGTPFPADRRAAADALYGLGLPAAPDAGTPARSAELVLASVLDKATDPISVLALGPLTTLGRVLGDPERAVRVASVTASLGALEVPGDVVPVGSTTSGAAEWNAHADPGAVQAVLESGVPLLIVPLDAADQVATSQTLVDGLAAGGDAPGARLAARLVAASPPIMSAGFLPHDALSAVSLSVPTLLDTRQRMLAVTPDGPDAGALVESESTGSPVQVALSADKGAFEVALLDGIRGGTPTASASPGGALTITGGDGTCTFDPGGTTAQGDAVVTGVSVDAPMIAILAGLAEGHGLDDLNGMLGTVDPAVDPPDWLLLAAYLEVDGGSSAQADAVLTPGDYAAICVTGEASTPHYVAAQTLLTIGG
jgi:inosine-uridine nucleoside N-ribohydrolase